MSEKSTDKRLWLGIVLLLVGSIFLIDNLDLVRIPYYFFSWEMLLIVIGFTMLITGRRAGFIFIAFGGLFMLKSMGWIPYRFSELFWPMILIVFGLYFITRRSGGRSRRENSDYNYLDEVAIFGGNDRIISSDKFNGGKVTSIFGGSEINLQDAKLSDKENVIDIFTLFGGSDFIVPADWNVKIKVFSIFGAFSDKRKTAIGTKKDQSKELVLKGFVCFGGGEIKSP